MIVEDEIRLRTSLANNIPWEEHGIEVVGLAGTGTEAIQLFKRKKPDLVLLDIHMPEMDGISVARELNKLEPLVKMVILSGHDNFRFAQAAIEAGVVKYLLKPALDDEILQAILEAANQLRLELDQLHNQEMLERKWIEHLPHLQNNFFQNWTEGKFATWQILKHSQEVQIQLSPEAQYAVVIMDMDPLSEDEIRFGKQDGPLLQFSLNRMVIELLESEDVWIFTTTEGYTALIFTFHPDEDENEALLKLNVNANNLLTKVKECLKLTASAGICGSTGTLNEVHKLYTQARRALQGRAIYGHHIAIPFRDEKQGASTIAIESSIEKNFEIALETGDLHTAEELLHQLWDVIVNQFEAVEDVHEHVLYFCSLCTRVIQKQGWRMKNVLGADFDFFHNPKQLASKDQIYGWLNRTVKRITEYVQNQRKTVSHDTVKAILQLVEEDMHLELTLHTVADRLYVNSSYLSRLFKQETGKSFSAYVLERKMERAKHALLQGAKVYDAANMVGYRDVSYFTKVFRKYWGVTPGEMKP